MTTISHRNIVCFADKVRNTAAEYLNEKDIDRFYLWAFGEDHLFFSNPMQFAKAWNRLHKALHNMDFSNSISDDVRTMVGYWCERQNQLASK